MDKEIEYRSPIIITRSMGKGDVVMISLEEYESLQETFYLLKYPKTQNNSGTVDSLEKGTGVKKELVSEV